jgi:hypothetical protein
MQMRLTNHCRTMMLRAKEPCYFKYLVMKSCSCLYACCSKGNEIRLLECLWWIHSKGDFFVCDDCKVFSSDDVHKNLSQSGSFQYL